MTKSIIVAAGLLAAAVALQTAAQTLYKSTLPDGRVVYGDKPDPAAVKVETTKADTSKAGIGGTSEREAQALKELQKARLQRESGEDKVRAAEKALSDAEAARAAGKEPLPGERPGIARKGKGAGTGTGTGAGTGTGTGTEAGSRLSEAYWERQKKLEDDVEKARRNLEQARFGK